MNLSSFGGAKYLVTIVDEASGKLRAAQMKSKVERANMLKRHAKWIERQTGTPGKKIVFVEKNTYVVPLIWSWTA